MGLRRRRHITTQGARVTALHDEIMDLTDTTRTGYEDPDGDAVLLAALNSARTGRMSDIVQTIQAEQDRIIRAAAPRGARRRGRPRHRQDRRRAAPRRVPAVRATASSWPAAPC